MESSITYTQRELDQQELFEKIIALKYDVQSIASIVQNPMVDAPDEVFDEWSKSVSEFVIKVNTLKTEVLKFYERV